MWSLLCYCVRDKDHCCVLCDVSRDLLFAGYIVHQPNVYQYGALIYLASLRQGLDYLPVNSKTSYPPGIPRVFFRTVGNFTQNEARPVGHWLSCQNVGQRFVQRVHHVQGLLTSLLLYSLFCWSIWEPMKLRANGRNIVGATLLANNSQHCVRLHVVWKSQLNAGFLKWTMLLEWTNLRKTVFLDLRYFGCVEEEIKIWINGLTHGENFRSCDHSDHMETWLFRVRGDDDRWDRTTLSYSLTCKIPTLLSI